MEKVLVTGGAGYIGSVLVVELLKKGYYVRVFDNFMYGKESLNIASAVASGKPLIEALHLSNFPLHKNLEVIEGDIRDRKALEKAVKCVDHVIHLAAIVGYPSCKKNEQAALEINYYGTKLLIEMAEKYKVKRFVFASSYSNYGISKGIVDETSELFPQSLYAETKIACEHLLQKSKVPFVILRFATVFGLSPRTRFDLMVTQFIAEARREKKLTIYQGDQTRSFLHVNDITRAIILSIESDKKKALSHVFNVGDSSLSYSKANLAKIVGKMLNSEVILVNQPPIDGDMRNIECSFEKIKKLLNFEKTLEIEDCIKEVSKALSINAIKDPFSEKYKEREGKLLLSEINYQKLREEMNSVIKA